MMATFVEVDHGLLDRIQADPSIVEGLFMPELPAIFDPARMRTAVLERGPQLMAGALQTFPPELRERIEQSLGRTQAALRSGEGGEALLALMQSRLGGPPGATKEAAEGTHRELDLDKAWHGVHYVLSGTVQPGEPLLSRAVLGGTEIGDDFSGYGHARFFTPAQVRELAGALDDSHVEQDAVDRYDPKRMTELGIYPFGWDDPGEQEWIMDALRDLRDFYSGAASRGHAVVTCLV